MLIPCPPDPGHGSCPAVVPAVPWGLSQACGAIWGYTASREWVQPQARAQQPEGQGCRHEPPKTVSFRDVPFGILQEVTPAGWIWAPGGLAARCHSAARAPLSGPSVLTTTTVSHCQSFTPGYLSFGCRQNETARAGRLAARPIKVQTALPCQRASPGPAGLTLPVLRVRARAVAELKVVVEIPGVRQWKVNLEVNVKIVFKKKSWKARNVGESLVSPEKNATALFAISATMSTISKYKTCVCFNLTCW